jgi:hypothetical protein
MLITFSTGSPGTMLFELRQHIKIQTSVSRIILQCYMYFMFVSHSIKANSVYDCCLGFMNSFLATRVALSSTDDILPSKSILQH